MKIKTFSSEQTAFLSIKNIIICTLFFFLPAANNYPGRIYYFLANLQNYFNLSLTEVSLFNLLLLPTIVISTFMLVYRMISAEKIFEDISPFSLCLFAVIFLFFLAGSLSTLANYETWEVMIYYISSIFSTFWLTLAFINLRLNLHLIRSLLIAFACGCGFPLILGLYAYYQAWGIPNLDQIILSHFNHDKMQAYGIQTFGNVDNTAIFIGMAGIIFFGCLLNKNITALQKSLYAILLTLAIIHLFILEVRTSIILFLLITLFLSFLHNKKLFLFYLSMLIGIFFLLYFLSPKFISLFFKRMTLALTWTSEGSSQSAAERLQAMHTGWRIFMNNFFLGVGPGASQFFTRYSTAHQFNIQQGVELGFLGFLASILLCILAIYRFIRLSVRYYSIRGENIEKLIFSSAVVFYFIYAIVANTPLAAGVVNTWISLAIGFLLLSDTV